MNLLDYIAVIEIGLVFVVLAVGLWAFSQD